MIIAFVRGQALTLPPTHTVGGSRDYLEMQVNFQTSDWAGLSKWVHFIPEAGGEEWRLRLEDDKITKARQLNLRAGKYQVYIHGTATDGMRITTDLQPFEVKATGIGPGDDPLGTAPEAPIEDLDRRVTRIEQQGVGPGPDGGQGGPSDAVRYGPQDLSEKEKEQARKNIGAGSVKDLSAQVQRAETAARNAASSQQAAAGNAQTATSAAETATGAASAAAGSAQSASADAGRAEAAQSAANGSAATAQQQAEAAAGSAQDAATQAENASSSATTAQQNAEAAAGSAQTASTAAGNSSTYADASRQNAENAFASAQTAKSEADRAKREADRAAQAESKPAKLATLTFTGAVQETYDGTKPVTVDIPTVQDVLDALPKWTGGAF